MSTEYTPTTTDVIYAYRVAGTIGPAEYPQRALDGLRYQAEFDRWLAAHDGQVRKDERERAPLADLKAAWKVAAERERERDEAVAALGRVRAVADHWRSAKTDDGRPINRWLIDAAAVIYRALDGES